jgi:hypothetical protein
MTGVNQPWFEHCRSPSLKHSGRLGILPTACLRAPLPLGRRTDGYRPLQPAGANPAGTHMGYAGYQKRVSNHCPHAVRPAVMPLPGMSNRRSFRALFYPALGCIIPPLCTAATAIGGRGFARGLLQMQHGTAPRHNIPPKGFHDTPKTHASMTWEHGRFPSHTMQSKVTGVSPMHGIGKMERFQPPETAAEGPRRHEGFSRGPP